MKNIIVFFVSFISAFVIYALIGGMISLVFCVGYKDVVQTPMFIVFVGIFAFSGSIYIGGVLSELEDNNGL